MFRQLSLRGLSKRTITKSQNHHFLIPKTKLAFIQRVSYSTTVETTEKPQKVPPSAENPRPILIQYLSLIKVRLATLVLATTAAGYVLGPCPLDPAILGYTCLGTFLTIGSANSINQYIEIDNDTMMKRTATRPLPTGEMSLNHALAFGVITGIVGSSILAVKVNETAAILAFTNILLYTLAYTPLKQIHWTNTWVGAIVGAIPPLIGWVANAGEFSIGAWVLAYALFIWQIPHFLALSVPLEQDYQRAGYKMLVNKSADKVATLTLRYSIYLLLIGPAAVYGEFMDPTFLIDSTVLNLWMVYKSYGFWKSRTSTDARKAFMATLYYLPLLIILLLLHKKKGYSLEEEKISEADGEDITVTPEKLEVK